MTFDRLLTLVVFAMPGVAGAQTLTCLNQSTGAIDGAATQAFADMQARTDSRLAQALAGTWYSETPSPATGQISRLELSYGADGSLSYRNQVCDQMGFCPTYEGFGAWAAIDLGGGGFSGIQMISDLNRNHECTGFSGQFLDGNTVRSGTGGLSYRMN